MTSSSIDRMEAPEGITICGGGTLTPEAKAELEDFARWLRLPKPRPEFRAWRKASAHPHSDTPPTEGQPTTHQEPNL